MSHNVDGENQLTNFFVCPGFMNSVLLYVRPVLSLDAASLKSSWAGTLYLATVKTPLNEIYPVAVAIIRGNEDQAGWTFFLENLSAACPLLSVPHHLDRVWYKYFTFVSDRDKGLKEALAHVFPENHKLDFLQKSRDIFSSTQS